MYISTPPPTPYLRLLILCDAIEELADIYKETEQDSKQIENYKGSALQAPIALQTMNTDTRVVSVGQLPLVQQGLLLHKMAQTLYPHEVFIHRLSIRYRKPNL